MPAASILMGVRKVMVSSDVSHFRTTALGGPVTDVVVLAIGRHHDAMLVLVVAVNVRIRQSLDLGYLGGGRRGLGIDIRRRQRARRHTRYRDNAETQVSRRWRHAIGFSVIHIQIGKGGQ
nr:hypothetical protein [Bordetella pertussis]